MLNDFCSISSCTAIYDLIDGILIVRAEPEQKVYLQGLRKIFFQLGAFAHPVVFIAIDRISIAYIESINEILISGLEAWLNNNNTSSMYD